VGDKRQSCRYDETWPFWATAQYIFHLATGASTSPPGKECGHLLEHNLDITERVSRQRRWLDVTLLIVMMVWIGFQVTKLLLIVPSQKWHVAKELIGIVNVSTIVIDPRLKLVSPMNSALILKKNWSGENTFVSTTAARSHIECA